MGCFVFLGSTYLLTCSALSLWFSLCKFCKINSTAWCFQCSNIGCFELKFNWFLHIITLARISPSSSKKDENSGVSLLFGISFSAFRDFFSSPNCSSCSNLEMIAFAFSLLFFNADYKCCWFVLAQYSLYVCNFVLTSLLKLLNGSQGITVFFSSACFVKTDESRLSSSEAQFKSTHSGYSLSGCFKQAGPVSHSLRFSSSLLIALVPMSTWFLIPLTCFHWEASQLPSWNETLVVYNRSCNTVVESGLKLKLFNFILCCFCSFICSFSITAMTVACNSRVILKDVSLGQLGIFQWQILSQLIIFWL